MRRSIYWKTFFSFTTVMVFIIVGFGSMFLYLANRYSAEEKLEMLHANGAVVADLTLSFLQTPMMDTRLYANTLMYLARLNEFEIVITDSAGNMLVVADRDSYSTASGRISHDIVREIVENGEKRFTGNLGGIYETPMFTVGLPVKDAAGNVGAAVFLSTEGEKMYSLYFDISRLIALSALVVFIAGTMLSTALGVATSRPLRQIGDAARSYAKGDFSVRVRIKGNNEFADLAETFNSMAQSLEEYDRSRDEFLANIAHELRTPMTSIAGYIEGILDGTIPRERQDEYLKIAEDEVHRLSRLISSILYLSRINAETERLNLSVFNICDVTGQVMLSFEPEVNKRNITVEAEFSDYDILVRADKDSIIRVIYNLFGNAVKFCDAGGRIDVKISSKGHKATISVRNTGEGISEADLPNIFDRFFKGDRSRGMEIKSTGLGLSISKSIIGMHGEEIWAASLPGHYAEFSFTLTIVKKMIDTPKSEHNKLTDQPRLGPAEIEWDE